MITPQTNSSLEEIAELLKRYQRFVICGHVSPDGDCLGSQLALAAALRSLGKDVTCLYAKDNPVEANLHFLVDREAFVVGSDFREDPEVFVAVDVPTMARLGTAAEVHRRAQVTVTIDHHANEEAISDYNYIDPDASSASLLIWKLAGLLGAVDSEVAECALVGLITDTGRFSFQNTTPEAFAAAGKMTEAGASPSDISREIFQNRTLPSLRLERLVIDRMTFLSDGEFVYSYLKNEDFVACGAIRGDAEVLIDVLRGIAGVKVALILRENDKGEIRGSLRAKDDTDVSAVARFYGGGGHRAAAGFTFVESFDEALVDIPGKVLELCFPSEA